MDLEHYSSLHTFALQREDNLSNTVSITSFKTIDMMNDDRSMYLCPEILFNDIFLTLHHFPTKL